MHEISASRCVISENPSLSRRTGSVMAHHHARCTWQPEWTG